MPGIAGADKFAAMLAAKKAKKMPKKGAKKPMPPMKKKGGKIDKADAGALSGLY